jgi:hypothetical protein
MAERQQGHLKGPGREELTGARSCLFGVVLGLALWVIGVATTVCAVAGCFE